MSKSLRPIKDRVLVQLHPREEKVGNIYRPEKWTPANIFGTVRACGETVPACIQDGDEVLVLNTSGTHFRMKGLDFIILPAEKIRAKKTK